MRALIWIASLESTTEPHPPATHHRRQQAVCKGWVGEKHGVIAVITHADVTHCFDGMGGFYEDKLTFNYEHKHSDKKSLVWAASVERQTKPGKTSGQFLRNVAQPAGNPVSQSEGISPVRSVPVVVLYGVALFKNTWGIIFQETPKKPGSLYLGLSTLNSDVFGKIIQHIKMPTTIIYENKRVILVVMSFGLHHFDIHTPFVR